MYIIILILYQELYIVCFITIYYQYKLHFFVCVCTPMFTYSNMFNIYRCFMICLISTQTLVKIPSKWQCCFLFFPNHPLPSYSLLKQRLFFHPQWHVCGSPCWEEIYQLIQYLITFQQAAHESQNVSCVPLMETPEMNSVLMWPQCYEQPNVLVVLHTARHGMI